MTNHRKSSRKLLHASSREESPPVVVEPTNYRGFQIYSHLIALCALIGVFVLISAFSFWYGSRFEGRLEASLKQNLSLLTKLPDLRAGIRQVDLLGELFFKTGEPQWLERRRMAIADVRNRFSEIESLSTATPAQGSLSQFDHELTTYLDQQQSMIQVIQADGLRQPAPQERDQLRSHRDNILEIVSSFGDQAALELQMREFRVQAVSHRLYLIRLAFEILISMLVTFYLLYFILRPLRVIEEITTNWKLGEPWPQKKLSSIPEVRHLFSHFEHLAGRLNGEFGHAEELSEFKTKLVSIVSHEFGNALAVFQSASYLLQDKLPPELREENGRLFRMISSNISEMAGAIQNLLNMGRVNAGKLADNFVATDAAEILRSTFKRMELLCEEKNLKVSLELPDGLEPVRADPAALSLVVNNLVSNAIKYTPENGRIALGIIPENSRPGYYRIYVQDTGIGVSEEDRVKILNGNYRSESSKRMTLRGFGVGLSLARQIIEAHDSAIEIEGSPGKGSRFSFLLPAASGQRPAFKLLPMAAQTNEACSV